MIQFHQNYLILVFIAFFSNFTVSSTSLGEPEHLLPHWVEVDDEGNHVAFVHGLRGRRSNQKNDFILNIARESGEIRSAAAIWSPTNNYRNRLFCRLQSGGFGSFRIWAADILGRQPGFVEFVLHDSSGEEISSFRLLDHSLPWGETHRQCIELVDGRIAVVHGTNLFVTYLEAVLARIALQVIKQCRKRGFISEDPDQVQAGQMDSLFGESSALSAALSASIKGKIAFGPRAGKNVRFIGEGFGFQEEVLELGFDVQCRLEARARQSLGQVPRVENFDAYNVAAGRVA